MGGRIALGKLTREVDEVMLSTGLKRRWPEMKLKKRKKENN